MQRSESYGPLEGAATHVKKERAGRASWKRLVSRVSSILRARQLPGMLFIPISARPSDAGLIVLPKKGFSTPPHSQSGPLVLSLSALFSNVKYLLMFLSLLNSSSGEQGPCPCCLHHLPSAQDVPGTEARAQKNAGTGEKE